MKFMVCYDSKEASTAALKLARAHAAQLGASMEIVKIVIRSESLKPEKIRKIESQLEAEVKEILKKSQLSFKVDLIITGKDSGEQIIYIADAEKIEQIYMGVKKKSRSENLYSVQLFNM